MILKRRKYCDEICITDKLEGRWGLYQLGTSVLLAVLINPFLHEYSC